MICIETIVSLSMNIGGGTDDEYKVVPTKQQVELLLVEREVRGDSNEHGAASWISSGLVVEEKM